VVGSARRQCEEDVGRLQVLTDGVKGVIRYRRGEVLPTAKWGETSHAL